MLKERIRYLCKTQDVTRKTLIEGLITQAHFANILAGRYALALDLAQAIAERLGVAPEYLIKVEDSTSLMLSRIDLMANQLLFVQPQEISLTATVQKEDELALELAENIMLAGTLLKQGQIEAWQSLHQEYLDFYLGEFTDERVETLVPELQKILYVYRMLLARQRQDHESVIAYAERLLLLSQAQREVWIAVQKFFIEALIYLTCYDKAQEAFRDLSLCIQRENLFHHLPTFHIMQSAYYERLGLLESAIIDLAKAEEALLYCSSESRGPTLGVILHNRILILIKLKYYQVAEMVIETFISYLQGDISRSELDIQVAVGGYRCAILLAQQKWEELDTLLQKLKEIPMRQDQKFLLHYYLGKLYFQQKNYAQAVSFGKKALEFIGQFDPQNQWIAEICLLLAAVAEKQKHYKSALDYYKRAYKNRAMRY